MSEQKARVFKTDPTKVTDPETWATYEAERVFYGEHNRSLTPEEADELVVNVCEALGLRDNWGHVPETRYSAALLPKGVLGAYVPTYRALWFNPEVLTLHTVLHEIAHLRDQGHGEAFRQAHLAVVQHVLSDAAKAELARHYEDQSETR